MPSYYFSSRHSHNTSTSSSSSWNEFIFSPKKKNISNHAKHQSMNIPISSMIETAQTLKLEHCEQKHKIITNTKPIKSRQKMRYDRKRQMHFHSHSLSMTKPQSTPSNLGIFNDTNIIQNDTNRRKRKHVKRAETVRVIRDKEVVQIDEEIPIAKFLSALKKGYARIMTENEQNEEYKKSAHIARSVSVGNMMDLLDGQCADILYNDDHDKTKKQKKKRKRKRKSKSTKSTMPTMPTIFSGDLVDVPVENQNKKQKKMKKKQQRKNARIRSQTAPKPKVVNTSTEHMKLPFLNHRRKRANHAYKPSKCPTSPSIPEEDDDCLNIIHRGDEELEMDVVSDQSTSGFDSDSDSLPSDDGGNIKMLLPSSPRMRQNAKSCNDMDNVIVQRTPTDEYDFEYDEKDDIDSPTVRRRANSNSSITSNSASSSNSSSSSSSSSSSDWDAEVREEEKAEADALKLQNIAQSVSDSGSEYSTGSDSDSVFDDEYKCKNIKESVPILLNRPTSDSDDDDDEDVYVVDDIKMDEYKSLILESPNSKLKDIYESQSELETSSDDELTLNNHQSTQKQKDVRMRPKSTPFRSSKGTAVFLSNLKRHRVDQYRGNLDELINDHKSQKAKKNGRMNWRRRKNAVSSSSLSVAAMF